VSERRKRNNFALRHIAVEAERLWALYLGAIVGNSGL